ncbi:putative MATE family efflux protein [Hypnocyclicus thermotrophus]|uniref:Multidrug export protein MepA n=1 Tax=Hypnocyclicus thermotrophus TaxID=1627895 RepID=A0AA46I668_9FUSO|nr:MATE family efflux transporter [Hypnocyclicus thermotrophus]TDT71835.1 putative MATE family efflux protein [Hypnocyclicus thermotrophus]
MKNRKHQLANEKILKLILKLSLPATIGMLVSSLYNLVDTIFVSKAEGPLGIAALTIVFPIQMLIMAFTQSIGIGSASIISRALGEHKNEKASEMFETTVISLIILSALVIFLGVLYLKPTLLLFGATSLILEKAKDYYFIILIGSPFYIFALGLSNIARAEGNLKVSMNGMLFSAILNIVLDPIFIFKLNYGIKGAALATVISQFISFLYLFRYFFFSNNSYIKFKGFIFRINYFIEMIGIGLSSFTRQAVSSIVAIVLNNTLKIYGGEIAIAIMGIINRTLMVIFLPMFGIIQGIQPIIGFNYGAKSFGRVKETLKMAAIITTIFCTIVFLIMQLFPKGIIRVFSNDINLINMSILPIRVFSLAFITIGFQIIVAGYYQSIGKVIPALILSIARQSIFLIPLILILPKYLNEFGIWISFPISDFMGFLISLIFILKEYRKNLSQK